VQLVVECRIVTVFFAELLSQDFEHVAGIILFFSLRGVIGVVSLGQLGSGLTF